MYDKRGSCSIGAYLIDASQIPPADVIGTAPRRKSRAELTPRTGLISLAVGSTLAAATAIECHSLAPETNSLVSWALSLGYGAILWVWWALVVELLCRAGKRWPATLRISAASSAVHLTIASGVAMIHLGILHLVVYWVSRAGPEPERAAYFGLDFFKLGRFGIEFLIYTLIWFACAALNTQLVAQRDAMRSLELERQLSSVQLRALQSQLEPHFLFNTLNAVTTLMEVDRPEEALATLGHLNTILKTVLNRNVPRKVPLTQELEIVESYLAIERVRLADRLQVDINLDPNALDGLVPCFLLQPIIENAIRHGISRCENKGYIETSVRRIGERMQLYVRDNGPGLNGRSKPGFGVGLTNTRERLFHFYQDNCEFRAFEPDSGGFEVSISIPYETTAS